MREIRQRISVQFGEGDVVSQEELLPNPFVELDKYPTIVRIGNEYSRARDFQSVRFSVSIEVPTDFSRMEEAADYAYKMCDYVIDKYSQGVQDGLAGLCADANSKHKKG